MAKAATKRKAANGYKLAERLPKGEILEDVGKKKWKLGSPIGQGGFGEIYEAREAGATGSNYPYVIKIEPHANGPLFVEMHFYMRNAKISDVEEFKKEKGLKTFGMPVYLGSGSHEFKTEKYRFLVMDKLGTDLWKIFLENNKIFPPATVFKLGIQILDVLEYIHKRGYVHADIKGANILMGVAKGTTNQVYVVDFGLATKFTTETEFKPNPKKAHDGTIEYLSCDAHKGVQTRRGDLEILAYNLLQWLGCTLPWENNLKDPNIVHKTKEEYMSGVTKMIKSCFGHKTPIGAMVDYLNYLKTLDFNSEPDYKKIRNIFMSGIKDAGGSLTSPLVFSLSKKTPQKRKSDHVVNSSPKRKVGRKRKVTKLVEKNVEDSNSEEETCDKKLSESDVTDEDIIEASYEEPKLNRKGLKEKNNKSKEINKSDAEVNKEKNNKKPLRKTKKKEINKATDEEQNEEVDPYEGYTEAMKEIMMKKLQGGNKNKKLKNIKQPVVEDMEGYTDSMKEFAIKKKERLAGKRGVKTKSASSVEERKVEKNIHSDSPAATRETRLRKNRNIYYCDDQFDSD